MKILYVPLDERPCNYKYPKLLAQLCEDIELLIPPLEYMGKIKKPADINKIWKWIFSNANKCNYFILSVDTLIYGNIINSRIHCNTVEKCTKYINNFKRIKQINPEAEIHAFNLVARVANYNSNYEDPDYWEEYGKDIWQYCYFTDKIERGEANEQHQKELKNLNQSIPNQYLNDFLKRREVNRFVNLQCLKLVKDKIIDYLVIPKDDCAEYGFAAMDQNIIARKIFKYNIMKSVMVYPGADEVGCVLLVRVFNKIKKYVPRVYVRYSSTFGGHIIPKYEDRPLHESIKYQITSIGGILVDCEDKSDLLLAINSPGKNMIEALEQHNKDVTFYSYRNIHEFAAFIEYYLKTYKKPCAVADVLFSNGSDNELMNYLNECKLLEKISAYSGWNTAQNTIGTALAHGVLCSYYNMFNNNYEKYIISSQLLFRKIIEDWFVMYNVFCEMLKKREKYPNIDPYNVGIYDKQVTKFIKELIKKQINDKFKGHFMNKKILLSDIDLPWNRIFEIDFNIKLVN